MTTISSRIKRAAEFEGFRLTKTDWQRGAQQENARLTPLISALADCVSALEKYRGVSRASIVETCYGEQLRYSETMAADEALSRLTQLLPKDNL